MAPWNMPMTRSPGASPGTSGPSSVTTPAPSPPITACARIHAQRDQHVPEVHPRRAHGHPHLAGPSASVAWDEEVRVRRSREPADVTSSRQASPEGGTASAPAGS